MKKFLSRLLCLGLLLSLLLPAAPKARADTLGLSALMDNPEYRLYVEAMVGYHLQKDAAVRKALREGYCAMFLFEGCSDNMDDPALADLTYYRVSAVCLVLKLDENGEPYLIYFNDGCSTIPDRPLDYGAWNIEGVGDVGPATICDGTYELYSVRHMGAYEALHIRDSYEDGGLDAVYMISEGFTSGEATSINIHTRTGNHTISRGMWSAGCMLVGDGEFWQFTELMESTYYNIYDTFEVDRKVGTVTINRQCFREALLELYENPYAVEYLLRMSDPYQPETYLEQCVRDTSFGESRQMRTVRTAKLMTLPCSSGTDARSVELDALQEGDKLEIIGAVRNSAGNLWYEVEVEGRTAYLYSGDAEEVPDNWFARILEIFFG